MWHVVYTQYALIAAVLVLHLLIWFFKSVAFAICREWRIQFKSDANDVYRFGNRCHCNLENAPISNEFQMSRHSKREPVPFKFFAIHYFLYSFSISFQKILNAKHEFPVIYGFAILFDFTWVLSEKSFPGAQKSAKNSFISLKWNCVASFFLFFSYWALHTYIYKKNDWNTMENVSFCFVLSNFSSLFGMKICFHDYKHQ